jgi:hypothetical protein
VSHQGLEASALLRVACLRQNDKVTPYHWPPLEPEGLQLERLGGLTLGAD